MQIGKVKLGLTLKKFIEVAFAAMLGGVIPSAYLRAEDNLLNTPALSSVGRAFIGCMSSAIQNKDFEQISLSGHDVIQLSCRSDAARQLYAELAALHREGDYSKGGYSGKVTVSRFALCLHVLEHNGQTKDGVICNLTMNISK